ncbi:TetR/AcrR family transcriptional regulator [Microbacterium atlanticum]|uniref:TetR/AcrR family transcriptional regulator n=1 Tax=Microbacterium atlanticum TaxID=2782168 RepID=UPI0018877BC9|nr:TetR/AcrR family transcriptional regulator [Microbacterium atlanticum]
MELRLGDGREERADAARNRRRLLAVAREILARDGIDRLTMDALAQRSGLGKGTVYRRFGSRAGIFLALLDERERELQAQMLSGPPPLGPGADPIARLIAYGHARIGFLLENLEIARASLDGRAPSPGSEIALLSETHILMLLRQIPLGDADREILAVQLVGALEGPELLLLAAAPRNLPDYATRLLTGWADLIARLCGGAESGTRK